MKVNQNKNVFFFIYLKQIFHLERTKCVFSLQLVLHQSQQNILITICQLGLKATDHDRHLLYKWAQTNKKMMHYGLIC